MHDIDEGKGTPMEQVPMSKLLNYTRKDELKAFITEPEYLKIENEVKAQTGKSKVNMKDMKKYLAADQKFASDFKSRQIGKNAYHKYLAAASRMRNMDRTRGQTIRRGMTQPRHRFLGCIATKVQPKDYEDCLDHYNQDKYDNISLVPTGLKQRVSLKTPHLSKHWTRAFTPSGLAQATYPRA